MTQNEENTVAVTSSFQFTEDNIKAAVYRAEKARHDREAEENVAPYYRGQSIYMERISFDKPYGTLWSTKVNNTEGMGNSVMRLDRNGEVHYYDDRVWVRDVIKEVIAEGGVLALRYYSEKGDTVKLFTAKALEKVAPRNRETASAFLD